MLRSVPVSIGSFFLFGVLIVFFLLVFHFVHEDEKA